MMRWHQFSVAANLTVLLVAIRASISSTLGPARSILGRRSRGAFGFVSHVCAAWTSGRAIGAEGHVAHALACLPHLELSKFILEEQQIPAAIAHLGVEPGADGLVIRLRTHGVGSGEEGIFALDLLKDVLDSLVLIHLCDGVRDSSRGVNVGFSPGYS
jgi:hypothetical protein